MAFKARPVVRNDGKRYASGYAAAKAIAEEIGNPGRVYVIANQICQCCRGRYKTVRGYGFEYEGVD